MQVEVLKPATASDDRVEEQKSELPKPNEALFFWIILFVFGGGLLALYYGEIRYFPEFTWEESLSYLALMAITGGSLAFAYLSLLLIPGAIWSEFLIFDPHLHRSMTHGARGELCVMTIAQQIVAPFAFFMIISHVVLAIAPKPKWSYILGATVLYLTVASIFLWKRFKDDLKTSGNGRLGARDSRRGKGLLRARKRRAPNTRSLRCRYLVAFNLAALLSLLSILFFNYLHEGRPPASLLVLCTFVVVVTNLLVSLLFHSRRWQAFVVSFLASLVLLVSGSFVEEGSLSRKIMARFGFGEQTATLVVTEQASRLLQQFNVPVNPVPRSETGPPDSEEPQILGADATAPGGPRAEKRFEFLGRVEGVTILSRLGSDFLLCYDGRAIALPKKEVLSWSAVEVSADNDKAHHEEGLLCKRVAPERPASARPAETRLARGSS